MPQISPPERGQPIDVDYLYEIVNAINTINNQIVSTSNAESRVAGTSPSGTDAIKTSSLKFYAIQVPIPSRTVSADENQVVNVQFQPSGFLYPPIVTVTPIVQDSSDASQNVIATIKNVTTNGVDVIVVYKKAGQLDVDIHLLAVGQAP
jgi:hypothetical protein